MNLKFDYYHNLEKVELRLCNPDGRELYQLPGYERNLTLRFNDISELTFKVSSEITLSTGDSFSLEAYDYIQTKRLVYATNVGWFQICRVDEHDDGKIKHKTITAESYQSVLKHKGFMSEERVYCFYNPNDPYDDYYDWENEESIPSVLGQLSKQLGIKQALGQGLSEPDLPYEDWTITYVSPSLTYAGEGSICRTFSENITFGYDWIVNEVENAFGVIVLFDFFYKTIHVVTPAEVTQKANVVYSFRNFMKNVEIEENAEDIVTVLNCSGNGCDITSVNPTGSNFICDFSYFMDEETYRWMSKPLIDKLKDWGKACDDNKEDYANLIEALRKKWKKKTECTTKLQEMSLALEDLKTAQAKRSVVGRGTAGALCGTILAESVESDGYSIDSKSKYYNPDAGIVKEEAENEGNDVSYKSFSGNEIVTAYQFPPDYENGKWVFKGDCITDAVDSIVSKNLSKDDSSYASYWYFMDMNNSDGSSYCKLESGTKVNKDEGTNTYYCKGYDKYIAYTYPEANASSGSIKYTDNVVSWISLREEKVASLNEMDTKLKSEIDSIAQDLDEISSSLNIVSYFSDSSLLRELNCYWIEGSYTNENITVFEETTPEEEINLANELLSCGRVELSKMCQPHLSFSVESRDATKQFEFKEQMRELELGKLITVEKEEGLWYYPALLEISMSLDDGDEFSMRFANAMRLDDWGYTYADLISDASSTSRKVSANWHDMIAYAKERETVTSLIRDPLNTALRASFANIVNQEFVVDKSGILGRKKKI